MTIIPQACGSWLLKGQTRVEVLSSSFHSSWAPAVAVIWIVKEWTEDPHSNKHVYSYCKKKHKQTKTKPTWFLPLNKGDTKCGYFMWQIFREFSHIPTLNLKFHFLMWTGTLTTYEQLLPYKLSSILIKCKYVFSCNFEIYITVRCYPYQMFPPLGVHISV